MNLLLGRVRPIVALFAAFVVGCGVAWGSVFTEGIASTTPCFSPAPIALDVTKVASPEITVTDTSPEACIISQKVVSNKDHVATEVVITNTLEQQVCVHFVAPAVGVQSEVTMGLALVTNTIAVLSARDQIPYVGSKAEVSVFLFLADHQQEVILLTG